MDTTPNCFSRWLIIAVLSMTGFNSPHAQDQEEWDVTVPRGNTREISFTTEEGIWMSTDISGDGSWVVFELLGHIDHLPVTGGQAVSLSQNSGMAMNYHPRISPDGREIPFVSDRGGQEKLWVMALEEEIGSVEVGKVADLVVLNSNSLDNIRNSTDIAYVMKAGRLYEADSLDELWPRQRPYGVLPWLNEDVTRTDLRPDDFWYGKTRP